MFLPWKTRKWAAQVITLRMEIQCQAVDSSLARCSFHKERFAPSLWDTVFGNRNDWNGRLQNVDVCPQDAVAKRTEKLL